MSALRACGVAASLLVAGTAAAGLGYALTGHALAQAGVAAKVAQKDIAFNPDRVEIKAGGTVTFVNEDPFGHNVYSESPGGEFDIGRQQMGQVNVITFRRPGTFTAQCRIHPKMHLEIVVTP